MLAKRMPLQAKADAARQETEVVSAENSQLGAHVQLLESELESARHGQATDSTEGSPRQSQLMVEAMPHGVTPAHLDMPEAAPQIPSAVSGMRPHDCRHYQSCHRVAGGLLRCQGVPQA